MGIVLKRRLAPFSSPAFFKAVDLFIMANFSSGSWFGFGFAAYVILLDLQYSGSREKRKEKKEK